MFNFYFIKKSMKSTNIEVVDDIINSFSIERFLITYFIPLLEQDDKHRLL